MAPYDELLARLKDDQLYSAGAITQLARVSALLTEYQDLLRVRIVLSARAVRVGYTGGDGMFRLPGQGPTAAWFSWAKNRKTDAKPNQIQE